MCLIRDFFTWFDSSQYHWGVYICLEQGTVTILAICKRETSQLSIHPYCDFTNTTTS